MRNTVLLGIVLLAATTIPSAYGFTPEQPGTTFSEDAAVEVYYFHYTRRCATCIAVEEVTEKLLKDLYPAEMQSGEIVFLSLDLEKGDNAEIAEKIGVSGQTLIVVKGDEKTNLTNTAFIHARSNPEKLKAALKEAID